ncbi:MAG: hypothetical protein J2P49_07245 [Methylocapsa sp.]|nr:hypothetical protein [Methylocapsa sp.]
MTDAWTQAAALKKLRVFRADRRGIVAIDFALIGMILAMGMINAVDVGFFIYQRMEVEYAAEVGAQAAYTTCVPSCTNQNCPSQQLPATQNCSGLNTAVTAAIQSTSLGTAITLVTGYPTEGNYCINTSSCLQCVGSISSLPPPPSICSATGQKLACSATGQQTDCSAAGNASTGPGDYIQVEVTYPYTPLFPGLSVMSALGISSITKTSWMRLG